MIVTILPIAITVAAATIQFRGRRDMKSGERKRKES
jgi:hypothetical protein